ncbi:MAG TPA: putative toxin-antitoxin system toxin component, PIN family [Thermomicrobiales bacterium]|nr:putative toxin-antitoxin system toxin component, PIN family [Thermomicrobiales bacterium]
MTNGALVRAVVDTNLFISALIMRRGSPYEVLRRLRARLFVTLTSDMQRRELRDVLSRPHILHRYRLSEQEITDFFKLFDLAGSLVRLDPSFRMPVEVRDPQDVLILATALAGNAQYLVTGDRDLLVLADDPRLGALQIVTATEFLSALDVEQVP